MLTSILNRRAAFCWLTTNVARTAIYCCLAAAFAGSAACGMIPGAVLAAIPEKIHVKIVIVTMFEVGEDLGDRPGELQYWVERDHLDKIYPFAAAYHDIRANDGGELAIVTGQGTAHAAAALMALGLDPRFDLSHAYWLIAGIAGANPERASLGSAVWANWVVDGDLGYEIDAREMPADWTAGILPLGKATPFETPLDEAMAVKGGQIFQTNRDLMLWAYHLTKATDLGDSDKLKEIRARFDGAMAKTPPKVLLGDEISSSTYWHGKVMDAWADKWMTYFTAGQGKFVTTAMEDSGSLESLQLLAKAGSVDWKRILVLRTVSNFDQQPRGMDAATSLSHQRVGEYGAYLPSLESAYRVGHAVVAELIGKWSVYRDQIPAESKGNKE